MPIALGLLEALQRPAEAAALAPADGFIHCLADACRFGVPRPVQQCLLYIVAEAPLGVLDGATGL